MADVFVAVGHSEASRDPLFGTRIRKRFVDDWYDGRVTGIDQCVQSGDRFYVVEYTDGDAEHMAEQEVRVCMVRSSGGSSRLSNAPTPRVSTASLHHQQPQPARLSGGIAASVETTPANGWMHGALCGGIVTSVAILLGLAVVQWSSALRGDSYSWTNPTSNAHVVSPPQVWREASHVSTVSSDFIARPASPDVAAQPPLSAPLATAEVFTESRDILKGSWVPNWQHASAGLALALVIVLAMKVAVPTESNRPPPAPVRPSHEAFPSPLAASPWTTPYVNDRSPSPYLKRTPTSFVHSSPSEQPSPATSLRFPEPLQASPTKTAAPSPARTTQRSRCTSPAVRESVVRRSGSDVSKRRSDAKMKAEAEAASKLVSGPRFKHGTALKQLVDMGFDDNDSVRQALTKHKGNVPNAMREIVGDT